MKAISIDPEYALYIFNGEKSIECRTWQTKHRGALLVCAGKQPIPGCINGRAYFTVELVDIEPFTKEHLKQAKMDKMPSGKYYAWHIEDVRPIYPIPVRGKLGLFDVDDSLIRYLDDEIPEDATDEEIIEAGNAFYEKYLTPLTYLAGQR